MKANHGLFAKSIHRVGAGSLVAFTALATACSGGITDEENVGQATVRIAEVPAATHCIEIEVANSSRMVEQLFDVMPGQSSVLNLESLPTGSVTFNGFAYSETCANVLSSTLPTWQTAPTPATLTPGVLANVVLTFLPNGVADVTADFVDEGTTTCPMGEVSCDGACVDPSTDPANCGACGNACAAGQSCSAGACLAGFAASFSQGLPPPPDVCQAWNDFRGGLTGGYTTIRLQSSLGPTVVCNDPGRADQLCQALRTGANINLNCSGHQWSVGFCEGGVSLSLDAGFACACGASNAIKPCNIGPNWGGVNNQVCGAQSQDLSVRCE